MGGLAGRRCDSCNRVVLISDRGVVETVGNARRVETDHQGNDRAFCTCGTLVSWPRKSQSSTAQDLAPIGLLDNAHPRNFSICQVEGHDVASAPLTQRSSGRFVTVQNFCVRCGLVCMTEGYV